MRCVACDVELTDRESTNKFLHSGTYADMCRKCLSTIQEDAPTEDDDVVSIEVREDESNNNN